MDYKVIYQKLCNPLSNSDSAWYRGRGFEFEKILKACLSEEGLEPRSSYKSEGEQIDGSFFVDGSVFLLEAKWHKDKLPASTIYQFKGKVDGKLIGTIGVFISMSGYSEDAVDALTLGKALNVILFDKNDIDHAMSKNGSFKKILKIKLRMAAEEGIVYHSLEVEQVTKTKNIIIEEFAYNPLPTNSATHQTKDDAYDLVVICEGNSDRELISLFSTIILKHHNISKKINIIIANGKMTIPRVANAVATNTITKSPILIIVDSDNNKEQTLDMLKRNINFDNWSAAIPEPSIESWLSPKALSFTKGKSMMRQVRDIIDSIDLVELAERDSSFKVFYNWVINA